MVDGGLWYPAGVRDPAPVSCWGVHADSGEPKFLLHTTEGGPGVYVPDPDLGAGRRYYGNTGTWPNYTLAVRSGVWVVFQHVPAGRASLSLRNRLGGVQTNRDNVSQIEIAWKAVEIAGLPGGAVDELARLLAWEHAARGVPLTSTVRWAPYPDSYGEGAPQRLTAGEWDAYSGVLGHMHAPENDHGDPGWFPVQSLISRARSYAGVLPATPEPEEDDMSPEDRAALAADVVAALRADVSAQVDFTATDGGRTRWVGQGDTPGVKHGSGWQALGLGALWSLLAWQAALRVEKGLAVAAPQAAGVMGSPAPSPSSDEVVSAILAESDPVVLAAYHAAVADGFRALLDAARGEPEPPA